MALRPGPAAWLTALLCACSAHGPGGPQVHRAGSEVPRATGSGARSRVSDVSEHAGQPAAEPSADRASEPSPVGCVRVLDLPFQRVGDERILHLGTGPGGIGADVRLCPESERVRGYRLKVRESGVRLDCGGVVFDGTIDGQRRVSRALDVDRSALPIADVSIQSCDFEGYADGVRLIGPDIAGDPGRGLARFTLRDVRVRDTRGVGIYVGAHSRDVRLESVTVEGSRATGIYLDAGSSRTTVRGSFIRGNGEASCQRGREGMAIDASSDNQILDNVFESNRYAGIALYKNCGESGTPRPWPATRNVIRGNRFVGHVSASGAAVVIASRQGLEPSRDDCLANDCTDAPVGRTGAYRDHAPGNHVVENRFEDNLYDVRVSDADNAVLDNLFVRSRPAPPGGACIIVGHPFLLRAGLVRAGSAEGPVHIRGNVVQGPVPLIREEGGLSIAP